MYCVCKQNVFLPWRLCSFVDEGKLELDAPVTKYLPDFKMNDERYKDITVRMLMNHTSGIPLGLPINHSLYEDVDSFVHDNVFDMVSKQRLRSPLENMPAITIWAFAYGAYRRKCRGMSFTDYVRNNIASKIGADHMGNA